jgi:hypothetical protein
MTALWDILPCSLDEVDRRFRGAHYLYHQGALLKEIERASETSAYFNETTLRDIPESCHFHTRRCENLKSRKLSSPQSYDIAQNYRFLRSDPAFFAS